MSGTQSLVLWCLTEIQSVTNIYTHSMFNPKLQKEERYTLGDKWVEMMNRLGNARRAKVLGARSDASFRYMSKGRQLMAYISRLDPILEGTGFGT